MKQGKCSVFSQEDAGHSKHPFPITLETALHMDIMRWSTMNQIDYVLCSQRWRSSIQLANQDLDLTVAQIISSLLQNSGLNKKK